MPMLSSREFVKELRRTVMWVSWKPSVNSSGFEKLPEREPSPGDLTDRRKTQPSTSTRPAPRAGPNLMCAARLRARLGESPLRPEILSTQRRLYVPAGK